MTGWVVRIRPDALDVALALALLLSCQAEIWAPSWIPGVDNDVPGSRVVLTLTAVLMTVPLAWRRVWPLSVGVFSLGAAAAQGVLTKPTSGLGTVAAMLLAAFSISAYGSRRSLALGSVVVLAVSLILDRRDLFVLVLLGAALAMGGAVGRRTRTVANLRHRTAEAERQRVEAAAMGARDERLRIARELHDIVAHRVSMMVIESQAADACLDARPDAARAAIRAVEDAGRAALLELRALLGLLRAEEVPSAEGNRDPQPRLDDIAHLVDQARASGLAIEFRSAGTPHDVSPTVALAAYRIVQESITNIVKHAQSAPILVTLGWGPTDLEVRIRNEAAAEAPATSTLGYGIAGMRERAGFVGGALEHGPTTDGGWEVRATLPTSAGER